MFKSIIALFVFLMASQSFANIVGADTQNFNPDYGHNDFVTVRSSETIKQGHLNLTLFADYSAGTLPGYPLDTSPTVENNSDLGDTAVYTHFGVGLGLLDWLDIGFSMPVVAIQEIDSPDPRGQFVDEEGTGMVEMRFGAKARLMNFDGGGGLAVQGSIGLNQIENNPFIGDDPGPTFNIELIADKKFGRFHAAGNLGYRLRDPGPANQSIGIAPEIDIEPNGDIFIASAALSYEMNEKWKVLGELWASFPDGDFGGVAVNRDVESFEALAGLKYKWSDKLNIHGGATTGINNGISVPDYRLYAGLNYMFGPLWKATARKKVVKAKKIENDISYYDPGFRQGYMAGYGIGPYAGLGPNHGETLDGGFEYPEGYYDGYTASGNPFPDEVIAKTPYSKCYRTGFQGKIGNGPADGQGLGYGEVLGLGIDCSEGYDQGWNDAPDAEKGGESYYNPGYREGYKAGYGMGPYAGLGPNHGETLDGGFEFDQGYYDGYSDVTGPFPGSGSTRIYGKGYRNGFQGKLGKGPGKGTGPNFGATVNPQEPYPLGWEHGWIDAPGADPITLDAGNANAFDNLEAQAEESFRLENVLFDFNSYKIRKGSFPVLGSLARHLQKAGGFKSLVIEGHTDSVGKEAYNEKLSIQRAKSVKKFLEQAHGIDGSKIKADGWGERKPVSSNETKAGRQKNRRVEFQISR